MAQRIPELEFLSLVHDYSTYCQSVCRCRCRCRCLRRFFVGFVDEGNTILIRLLFGAPRSTKSLYRHIPQWNPKGTDCTVRDSPLEFFFDETVETSLGHSFCSLQRQSTILSTPFMPVQ